jgi:acyl transferase domain-containing protein
MGRGLYEVCPEFRAKLDEADALVQELAGWSLLASVFEGGAPDLADTQVAQPATFALQLALAHVLMGWIGKPDAVLGHSVGEYSAACVAGALDLRDAMRLVLERGKLMQRLPSDGAMAAVMASEARVRELARQHPKVELAAINGPELVVVSGPRAAVGPLLDAARGQHIDWRPLRVSRAFHSAALDDVLDELEAAAQSARFAPPAIPLLSNVTADYLGPANAFDAAYLRRQAREPVRFWDSIQRLRNDGFQLFLEIGPHNVLAEIGQRVAAASDSHWFSALKRGSDDWTSLLHSVGGLYQAGCPIDWRGRAAGPPGRMLRLPTYSFDRNHFWPFDSAATVGMEPDAARSARVPANTYQLVDTLDP